MLPEQYRATKKEIWTLTSYWSSQEQISRANPPIFICKWSFQMSVTGEVNGREGDVPQKTCLSTLFEKENKFWEWANLPWWTLNIREQTEQHCIFSVCCKGLTEKAISPSKFWEIRVFHPAAECLCGFPWFSNFCHCMYLAYFFSLALRYCSYVLVVETIPCVWVNSENTFGELKIVDLVAMNL